jgi:hypothetical protein
MPLKLIEVKKSPRADKKLVAVFQEHNGRIINRHFGSRGMSDYTINKDPARRALYLQRHQAREDWGNPKTAGALSRWILWGESTNLQTNIAEFKRKFNL